MIALLELHVYMS